jgi:Ser/Thr protein kinase RdoA (MazF antagonist)
MNARTHGSPMSEGDWVGILAHYDVGRIAQLQPGGGTAAPKVLLVTDRGRYLLRQRSHRSSSEDVTAFDHAVIEAVADAGLPVVRPLPALTGQTWVRREGLAYELFPFVDGLESFHQGDRGEIESAASILARFHEVTSTLTLPGRKDWPREHRAASMVQTLEKEIARSPGSGDQQSMASYILSAEHRLCAKLQDTIVAALPSVITHGDYTPANVRFRASAIGGIFDFDWASRQARLVDVGEALQYFACRRSASIDADDIWSLVQTWQPEPGDMQAFLAAYQALRPFDEREAAALPLFMLETWLGIRVRAMRKVPAEQRLLLLTRGAGGPLVWLEENAKLLSSMAMETAKSAHKKGR